MKVNNKKFRENWTLFGWLEDKLLRTIDHSLIKE